MTATDTGARLDAPQRTLLDLLAGVSARAPRQVLVRAPEDGTPITTWEFEENVRRVAKGLIAEGVRPGDRVAVLAPTGYEWFVAEFAILAAGAVAVPLSPAAPPAELARILDECAVVGLFAQAPGLLERAAPLRSQLTAPARIWPLTDGTFAELGARGAAVREPELTGRRADTAPGSLAALQYTAGTGGRPKCCRLTHGGLLAQVQGLVARLGPPDRLADRDGTARTVLSLPLAGAYGRVAQLACLAAGVEISYCPDPQRLPELLREVRPTLLLGAPELFERLYEAARISAQTRGRARSFASAGQLATAFNLAQQHGRPGLNLRLRRAVLNRLALGELRAGLGGRVRLAVSGGAPLGERMARVWQGAGVPVWEAYGLSEAGGLVSLNTPDAGRVGSVGRPLPGVEVRISDSGEVLVRGPVMCAGYGTGPQAEAFGDWCGTGDTGYLDADGYLYLTGRTEEPVIAGYRRPTVPAPLDDRVHAQRQQAVPVEGGLRPGT
ncbi:AMP-dependent synthetase/ligase [Streptomyces palmae]|uniref:Long-chain fatty acid--CoA ligase n=1 Tax=Streptomyces palmae TaxID=1701085 RepID=A0A4Z0HEP3_9ACTN|nr:AMP-binding protein [Streptomyces palmae]TGB18050.1 long-chain fatty acid--CoA ligase [Streptomyces palmae]